jgi:quercetin dioxygenase-like cupin family protein
MDRAAWEAEVKSEGYQIQERSMAAGTVNSDHTHPFDARLFVLSGAITITQDGKPYTYTSGESCAVPANKTHAEEVGGVEVTYLAGRRLVK